MHNNLCPILRIEIRFIALRASGAQRKGCVRNAMKRNALPGVLSHQLQGELSGAQVTTGLPQGEVRGAQSDFRTEFGQRSGKDRDHSEPKPDWIRAKVQPKRARIGPKLSGGDLFVFSLHFGRAAYDGFWAASGP
jgi:hypothetical protein